MTTSDFDIKPASRQGLKPLLALYGESGCGKSYSALLLGRGLVGPTGKIAVVDTESGRGNLYADVLPGGYAVLNFPGPFSPENYCRAIEKAESWGADVGILDSGSHEWEGEGGVLDMAAKSEQDSGKPGLHNWRLPKQAHNQFLLKLLKSRIPWIVCLRAKYKSRQTKVDGKTAIVRDDFTSPIQAEDFIFEATAHAEILQSHTIILTKCSHPQLRSCFPADKSGPLTTEHGAKIAEWCIGNAPAAKPKLDPVVARLKKELWAMTKGRFSKPEELEQWLWDEMCLDPALRLVDLNAVQLAATISVATKKL